MRRTASLTQCERIRALTLEHLHDAVPPFEYEAKAGYAGARAWLEALGGCTALALAASRTHLLE